jgi:nanoRNase/pAp phosphatase (c-di-AMP/oligoRNAs hydrolase)
MEPSDKDAPAKDEFEQVVDKLKSANNILVTVSTDPTVDQFAACIGLTLILNKIGKHANAVFSGKVPSAIEFLKPEKTLEKNTDSLRDFIIALDKSKADKLRYKVENEVVKIFITPYRTSISEKDLEFSQGDFNVDAIVALGVQDKNHIDEAILAHGRILHDASVVSINTTKRSRLGTINWSDNRASSLCEMVADISMELDAKVFDSQNSTALLTGIVAETERYSNDKAAPHTMSVAGLLMSAGASTQLVSNELASGGKPLQSIPSDKNGDQAEEDGVLEIEHQPEKTDEDNQNELSEEETDQGIQNDDIPPPPVEPADEAASPEPQEPPKEESKEEEPPAEPKSKKGPRVMHEPPEFGGKLTASTEDNYSNIPDPLSTAPDTPILGKKNIKPEDKKPPEITDDQTLTDIEKAVDSHHLDEVVGSTTEPPTIGKARAEVMQAEADGEIDDPRPEARQDMGTSGLGSDLHPDEQTPPESATLDPNTKKDTPPPPVPPPYLPPNS